MSSSILSVEKPIPLTNLYTKGSRYEDVVQLDGVQFIHVSPKGKTELGRRLSTTFINKFNVDSFGYFYSIEAFINFLTIQNYPKEFINKPKVTKKEFKTIGKPIRRTLGNFYSLVTLGFYNKVQQDEVLYKLLLENELDFATLSKKPIALKVDDSKKFNMAEHNLRYNRYINIIRYVSRFLKTNKNVTIDNKMLTELIRVTKDKPELDLCDGLY